MRYIRWTVSPINIWVYRLYNKIWRMSSLYESASLSTWSASSGQRTDSIPRSAGGSQIAHGKHQLFWLLHRSGCPASRRGPHDDLSSVWLQMGLLEALCDSLAVTGEMEQLMVFPTLRRSSSPSVGARVVRSGGEGLHGRPRPGPLAHILEEDDRLPHPRATIKAINAAPNLSSTTLAPTDHPASCLTCRFRLMPMRADQSAVMSINLRKAHHIP